MLSRMGLSALILTLLFAMNPARTMAQASSSDGAVPGSSPGGHLASDRPVDADAGLVVASLRPSSEYGALFVAPPAASLPGRSEGSSVLKALQHEDEPVSPLPPAEGKGSASGLGLMIGGAAALVGGLLIGGTAGDLIAIGGVGLGVWGIIVYF